MRTGKLLLLFTLAAFLLMAGTNRGTISGKLVSPEGVVRILATNLSTGERFSTVADSAGRFTLASLPAGAYRLTFRSDAGTAFARRELNVGAGETVRLNAKLEAIQRPRIAGRRAAARRVTAAATADLPPIVQQFGESSRDLNAVVLVDDNHGWAVGMPHWDQATRTTKGTIVNTTDGGVTWTNQDPGVTVALNGVFFLNTSQGWVVGDNGMILRTTDGGAHWTQEPVASADSFVSVCFTDAQNGWAASYAPIQYWDFLSEYTDWQASIWHSTDGGQTWLPQTVPASASVLKRIVFVNPTTGFAAGAKRTGYDDFGNAIDAGAIYGTTDGGQNWNEIFSTDVGFSFTALCFTDANHGWASGGAYSMDYAGASMFRTSDGGNTWQSASTGQDAYAIQAQDLHMLDNNRGYAAGTASVESGNAVWRTLDGGATWTSFWVQGNAETPGEGFWGVAVTANRVLIVGDRDFTAFAANPWSACTGGSNCPNLLTTAYISPHYILNSVAFTDRNHGWAAGTFTVNPQVWGQEILATQDGGQTWTSQFARSLTSGPWGPSSALRLDGISFADANNGWAAGSSEQVLGSDGGYDSSLGCIVHTSDGGKTWTDQGVNVCGYSESTSGWNPQEYSVIQALDAQNVWALAEDSTTTVLLAHTTDGGNHWTLVDTGIQDVPPGGMRFIDAQHGCIAGPSMVACTGNGGGTWTPSVVNCDESVCNPDASSITFADSLHGWIVGGTEDSGGAAYRSTDGGASWTSYAPPALSGIQMLEAVQFAGPLDGWAVGEGGLLVETADGGASVQTVDSTTSYDLFGLSFPDAAHGWIVGDYGTILSYAGDRTPAGAPAVFTALNAAINTTAEIPIYTNQAAPAAWISIYGADLSATTRPWVTGDFVNGKLPTKLDGVSVLVNGNPAYLSFISPGQINAMFPDDGTTGQVSVQVVNAAGSSGTLPVQKAGYSPALFRLSVEQGNYAIAQTTDGMLVGNYTVGNDLGNASNVRTANPGEIVTLYGTGFGPTNPALPSDAAVTGIAQTASPVTFTVGGIAAVVQWAGMRGPGLYQFNIYIPPNAPSGDLVIVAEVGGYFSQGDSVISVGAD
jgi:uncharacterized protein (TIGR03437 family)